MHAEARTHTPLHAASSTPLVSSRVNKGAEVVVRARDVLREEAASVLTRARQWMAAGRAGAAADVHGGARGVGGAGAEVGGQAQLERAREDAASVLARVEAMSRPAGGLSRSEQSEEHCAHAADTSSKGSSSASGRRERGDERHAETEERGGHRAWAWERTLDNCCSWERELVRRHTN